MRSNPDEAMRVNVDAITKVMRGGGGVDAAFAKSL